MIVCNARRRHGKRPIRAAWRRNEQARFRASLEPSLGKGGDLTRNLAHGRLLFMVTFDGHHFGTQMP
jgi:hypothetical protein